MAHRLVVGGWGGVNEKPGRVVVRVLMTRWRSMLASWEGGVGGSGRWGRWWGWMMGIERAQGAAGSRAGSMCRCAGSGGGWMAYGSAALAPMQVHVTVTVP